MVDISHETPAATEARLAQVIRLAKLTIYDAPHGFLEMPLAAPVIPPGALALVRDDLVWSALVPRDTGETFFLWRFHFPAGVDNSGFVGWLATEMKQRLGSGVFVVCGQNSAQGGIFDYWGCPWSLRAAAREVLAHLMQDHPCPGV